MKKTYRLHLLDKSGMRNQYKGVPYWGSDFFEKEFENDKEAKDFIIYNHDLLREEWVELEQINSDLETDSIYEKFDNWISFYYEELKEEEQE